MARGKRYPILKALEKEYNIIITNKQFDDMISLHIRKTYTAKKIYFIITTTDTKCKKRLK